MANPEYYIQERRNSILGQAALKRVSWGSIFAGALVAISCQLVLSLLGMGIGFTAIDPATEANPLSGVGTGALLWWSLSMLISLFLGGWVAGRLAGIPRSVDGFLHGFLSWGVVTIASVLFLTTAVGATLGGMGSIVSRALSAGGYVTAQAAPEQLRAAGRNLNPANLKQEARQAIRNVDRATQRETGQTLEQQARQKGQAAAKGFSAASFGAFVALLLGALVSGFGGMAGAPKYLFAGPLGRNIEREVASVR